jgi:glycosyltransferase involved in cell wall biosynthesis
VSEPPVVSVLMGVHDGAPEVRDAVESVLGQTLRDLELIVVDDASEDATPRLLAGFSDPRLVILRNGENIGLTRSLNLALAAARGRFVARQDADDRSLPRRLERQVAFLEARPDVGLCGTWARFVDDRGRVTALGRPPSDPDRLASALDHGNEIFHGTILARRNLMNSLGGYREGFRYAQDYDLYLRALERSRLAVLPEPLYELRFHRGAISLSRPEAQMQFAALARRLAEQRRDGGQDELDAGVPAPELIERAPPLSPTEVRRRQVMHRRLAGDLKGYRRGLLEMLRVDARDPRHYIHFILSFGGRPTLMAADRVAAALRRRPSRTR